MLSRVAERMYWLGRYVERIENTARLINVNTNLVLDLPKVKYIWGSLISITGYEDQFLERFSVQNEKNVIKFLLQDENCSISACIRMARENARTTREVLPSEAWEKINNLHFLVQKESSNAIKREGRHRLLQHIAEKCQELRGYLAGSMSLDEGYNFMTIGAELERADMTTRILDVGCLNLMSPEHTEIGEQETILWMSVLQSLTALQMYRQHVDRRINGEDVADFLLKDEKFPRAVAQCLTDVNVSFKLLPNHEEALRSVTRAQRSVSNANLKKLLADGELHDFIDEVQADLGDIHAQLAATWFRHETGD